MRALITGVTGFVGSHLAEYLLSQGAEVCGTIRWRSKTDNIEHLRGKLNLIECDIKDANSVYELVKKAEPSLIFHLAAQSFVPTSWHAPSETLETNIIGTLNILEAVRKLKVDPVIQIAGSSEEYGLVHPDETPITEKNELRPLSPYGVSKVAQDRLSVQYHKSYGLKTVVTRAFNHSGPRRGEVFVESNFAKQIAEIEKNKEEPKIHVGNLNVQRDFTDVRDVVRAYYLATQKCKSGEVYNICSETTWQIRDVLDYLLSLSKTSGIAVEQDPSRLRPSDVEILLGSSEKFRKETGWEPQIPFKKTLGDTLNYWREQSSQ